MKFQTIATAALVGTIVLVMGGAAGAANTDKTLVAWVTLTDKNIRAGSVLTVQVGNAFDGIIFAERAAGKWMAGSNSLTRTGKDPGAYPVETADKKTLVQMAIVYEGDRISIHRNGKEYASYKARNIDLLSKKDNIAVFGLRHIGGNGSIGGSIDDARIYSKALTVEELKSLAPNKASSIKPYAWWDFEGDKVVDRAGRYPHSKMSGGAKLADGKLVLGKSAMMVCAATKEAAAKTSRRSGQPKFTGPYVPETPAWPKNPPKNWLTFHLVHPGPGRAMPGDPNPAFYYKGRYHMHYIYRNHTGYVFAHVSSTDMVHWKWHPTVLAPPTTGHGMFSGTGFFTKEGKAVMIYHGQGSGKNWLAYALDDNMDKWSKPESLEPKTADGQTPKMRHWDPDCWLNGETYYALSGGKDPELLKSDDLKSWTHLGKLLHDDYPEKFPITRTEDISCANMFKIGGKWMLLCISHRLGCRYYLGDFKDEKYLPEFHAMMSWNGNHFFAPESMLTKDGRRVMWAWLLRLPVFSDGIQSLPRELELPADGVLRIKPLRELEKLRYEEKSEKSITVKSGASHHLKNVASDAVELKLEFKAPKAKEFGLDVLCNKDGKGGLRITVDAKSKTLKVGPVSAPFALADGENLTLRVFIDKNLVEVFANDRQAVMNAPKLVSLNNTGAILFSEGGDVKVETATSWKMKSVYKGSLVFKPKTIEAETTGKIAPEHPLAENLHLTGYVHDTGINPFITNSKGGSLPDQEPTYWNGMWHLYSMGNKPHFTSTDLVKWVEHKGSGPGGYTGIVVHHENKYYRFYTGGGQTIRVVVGDNPWDFDPAKSQLAAEADGKIYKKGWFRDAYVFYNEKEKLWWMLIEARSQGVCIALFKSKDLLEWKQFAPIFKDKNRKYGSCPQIFKQGGLWYLAIQDYGNHYYTAKNPYGPWKYRGEYLSVIVEAASRFATDGKRQLTWGWLCKGSVYPKKSIGGYGGPLCVGREMVFDKDGAMGVRPLPELLTAIRKSENKANLFACVRKASGQWNIQAAKQTLQCAGKSGGTVIFDLPEKNPHYYFEAELELGSPGASANIVLRSNDTADRGYGFALRPSDKKIEIRGLDYRSDGYIINDKKHAFPGKNNVTVQIFICDNHMEAFVDGVECVSAHVVDRSGHKVAIEIKGGSATIKKPLLHYFKCKEDRATGGSGRAENTDKTLVSWVTLTDKNVRAGSILTVQEGRRFDGIIYAERAAGKWMAGSNGFKRLGKTPGAYPAETADKKTLVQMAIVYKGDQLSIYRDGKQYASYKTRNIDLLSSKNNIVVFGLRHIGGNGSGSIGGAIDDARIYARALSPEELKSLEPNKASSIKPYAWWDFEGNKVVDRTGRYPHSKLTGGAKLADGSLVLGKGAVLVAGRTEKTANVSVGRRGGPPKFVGPYVPETPSWPKNPPDNWAIYHLAHPTASGGSPSDPNPAFYYKGRYHLHYIYRPSCGPAFAHVSSTDMVRWKWHPTVLAPPTTGHGMYSGTGFFTKEGKPAMVYCGFGSNRNWIRYGLDDELNKWGDEHTMLPKDADGKLLDKTPYHDPDIWLDGDTYYGLNGRSHVTTPLIMHSKDLKNWTQTGELLHPDFDEKKLGVPKGEDISCSNMFKLGKKWVLVCISHRLGCRYFIGEFKEGQYLPEQHALMGGQSSRFFAPESLVTRDGRRVMWAWFLKSQTKGVQSLPRELELPDDNVLRIKPLRELETLRCDEQSQAKIAVKTDEDLVLEKIKGDHLELKLEVKETGQKNFGVAVLCDDKGAGGVRITINRTKGLLEVGTEKAPFVLEEDKPLTLRVFVDSTIVEVFANDIQAVIADKKRAAGAQINDRVVLFSARRDMTMDKITAWRMKSAYEGSTVRADEIKK